MADIFRTLYGGFASPAETSGEARLDAFIKKFGGIFFPFLLCLTLMSAGLYIFTENVIDIFTIIAAAEIVGCFALLGRLRKIKHGGAVYFALLVAVMIVFNFLIMFSGPREFVEWFFSGGQSVDTRPVFLITFIWFFGFFFCSVIYYFTQVIYRSAAVVLISLIPLALSVKVTVALPGYFPFILAGIDLILFIYYSRQAFLGKSRLGKSSAALIVYTDFAVAAVLLALILPKPTETPYYERFEYYMSFFQFGGERETQMNGSYSRYSGNADDMLNGESRLLYYISTGSPVYMKTQVFDNYDSENNRWDSGEGDLNGSKNWQDNAQLLNFQKLDSAFRKVSEDDKEFYGKYPAAKLLNGISEAESFSIIYPRNYAAIYVLAPLRSTSAITSNTGARYTARTASGEIFTNLAYLPPNAEYSVRYYTENIFDELISRGVCDISEDDLGDMLNYAETELYFSDSESEEYKTVSAFLEEYENAVNYREDHPTEVSPEILELSQEITAGLEYDYQKAEAIEKYFYNNGFIYSLAYRPPEGMDTAEYFLFESKTGTCSDFATAFTLLARAAGLSVRYAEGFVPDASEEPMENSYFIYTENAHAYPEVYIAGAGWKIYEPTVPDLTGGNGDPDGNNADDALTAIFTAVIAVIVGGIFILLMIFRPKIAEGIFRMRLRFADNSAAVKLLYNRHARILGEKAETDTSSMTAEEVAGMTFEKTNIPLLPLTESFTEVCYGGREISAEKRQAAYDCYKKQRKELFRKNKKRKDR